MVALCFTAADFLGFILDLVHTHNEELDRFSSQLLSLAYLMLRPVVDAAESPLHAPTSDARSRPICAPPR